MSDSTNLQLPYLEGAQAQKHVTVNESVRKLDALVFLGVEDKDLTAPPGSPADGARYIPKATATGAWSGKENYVAHYVDGAWEFYTPREGWQAYVKDEDILYCYSGSAWVSILMAGLDGDLQAIAVLTPANDDVVQRKSGAWTNRTMAQLVTDQLAAFAQGSQGQLAFPATQNASSGANTLDDYEEGSWTPGLTFGGGNTGMTGTFNGRYVKIGKIVVATGYIALSAKGSSTGNPLLTGFPFTSENTANLFHAPIYSYASGMSFTGILGGYQNSNVTTSYIQASSGGTMTSLTDANFTNAAELIFTLIYRAAA